MKIPEQAPEFETNKAPWTPAFVVAASTIVGKANSDYLYWDDFKGLSMPSGVAPEQAWVLLKISRMFSLKPLSLVDRQNAPFFYWLPDSAQADLYSVDQAARTIAPDRSISPEDKRRYAMRSVIDEAISSSQLDGAATPIAVGKEMLRTGRTPADGSEQMICNTYSTFQMIKRHLREPLSSDLILRVQASLSQNAADGGPSPGRFRASRSGASSVHDPDGKKSPQRTPDTERAVDSLERLSAFINGDSDNPSLHPLIKGSLLHFWLAYMHPFPDANGRTARMLFYWYMLKHGYRMFEYLSLSAAIVKSRERYERSFLCSELDGNDCTYFLVYHLKAIRHALKLQDEYQQQKREEKKRAYLLAADYAGLNSRQRILLASAFEKPRDSFTIETHANVHGVTYQTARTDLLGLLGLGLFEMNKEGKKFIFTPVRDFMKRMEA